MTAKSPFSITGRICLAVTGLAPLSACMGGGAAQSTMPPAGGAAGVTGSNAGVYYSWMQPEIQAAWDQGYLGQGAQITIIDDFTSGDRTFGRLTDERQRLRHGEWVDLQTALMAPDATRVTQDFDETQSVQLGAGMLNVLNLSYGMFAPSGLSNAQVDWTARESSVINHARNGAAVVVKSAGNHAIAMGGVNSSGEVDYLDRALIGADTAIFVGALVGHGTAENPVSLASFSNFAGSDPVVQNQYLAVGLRSDLTSLNGTSFAAPIVSGYAAVLGSKFTTATPRQITSQLLQSARTDTILNYDPAVHGRGEASIARALAPASIR